MQVDKNRNYKKLLSTVSTIGNVPILKTAIRLIARSIARNDHDCEREREVIGGTENERENIYDMRVRIFVSIREECWRRHGES